MNENLIIKDQKPRTPAVIMDFERRKGMKRNKNRKPLLTSNKVGIIMKEYQETTSCSWYPRSEWYAKEEGIPQIRFWQIVYGEVSPTLDELQKIAQLLSIAKIITQPDFKILL